jgi:ABC-2 type transport system permease protein
MSMKRLFGVWRLDVGQNIRRPLFWILLLINALTAYGLSTGKLRIATGDSTIGATKAWITSEFAAAQMLTIVVFLFYSFFVAVAAGMSVINDDELKVGELLHATPLRPSEYVWGKFLGVLSCFFMVLLLHLLFMMFFNHKVLNEKSAEIVGPFEIMNYLRPAFIFTLPMLLFLTGASFAVGEWTRKPILVFVLPVALILACAFFLWDWTPTWLNPRIDQVLMLVDPAGFRWLNQSWLKVDRGVEFYNHAHIPFDLPFLISRGVLMLVGLLLVFWSQRHLTATLGGSKQTAPGIVARFLRLRSSATANRNPGEYRAPSGYRPLADLGMCASPPGFLRGMAEVARVELRELRSHPGLYLFVPIILLQVIGTSLLAVGAFGTPLLVTSGTLAVGTMNTLTLLVCLLLLFYTVESVQRERHTLLSSIHYATPVRTTSVLFGKAIANSLVGAVILVAAFAGCAVVLLIQGKVGLELRPFLVIWGVLLLVTFFAWSSFAMAVLAVTGNRYTTYGICLGAMIFTGYRQLTQQMNWVGNWNLWSSLRWSDMQWFGLDGLAVLLNRIMVLSLGVFFTVLAVRFFRRRDADSVRTLHRLQPWALVKGGLRLLPFAAVPVAAGIVLWFQVYQGFQGDVAKKIQKDYWRKNLATWKEAPLPAMTAVDLDVDLEPASRWFHVRGHYDLCNHRDSALAQIPLTCGAHWGSKSTEPEATEKDKKRTVHWTMNGVDYEPENRAHLFVFTPSKPLAPGETLRIGFDYEGTFPQGITKNGGGGTMEFMVPSAVVLTAFTPSFVPVLGYMEEIGIDDENRYERRDYPEKYYEGITEPLFGSATAFTTRIRITAPADYTLNSVGTRMSDTVADGRRTTVWQSDYPIRLFNIVAGRWAERRGRDTVVYYYPGHPYNIDEISEALDASRKYYSEWFYPYPWRELKLSEFPDLASYAQGFGTNITFSEGIGFLTKSDLGSNLAFIVTAHEAAHQWWGNIVVPGRGPGGNILAEGMAHFSTLLLCDQVKGPKARIEFARRIEERYAENRRKDAERPLVKIDGDRPGDTTVTYDKGGWVFWMLLQHMGREKALAGLQAFVRQYSLNLDHPVLEDFIAAMRKFAPDPAAYDAFVNQWFLQVVLPEYRLSDARSVPVSPAGSPAVPGDSTHWEVSVHVQNAGTGRMPVEIAAVSGERFLKDGSTSADYHDARSMIVLDAGASADVTIRCDFKPDRVVVDPDLHVFQLFRKRAVAPL